MIRTATIHTWVAIAALQILAGCSAFTKIPGAESNPASFEQAQKVDKVTYADKEALAEFERLSAEPLYRIGEGDKLSVSVWGRPEVSGKYVVGPDGRIALPLTGTIKLAMATREEAAGNIRTALQPYYQKPNVTVGVDEYVSNRVILLGRVENPGTVRFDTMPTLLEALARGGALPVLDKKATLTRSAIFRGRNMVIWVDLRKLLNGGDSTYNLRLQSNDVIYIPDSDDTLVYVMGDVNKPGSYRLTPDMSLLDALAQAGGPTENAAPEEIAIYRPSKKGVIRAPLKSLLTGDRNVNMRLEEGDIVFVPRSTLGDLGYIFREISPGLSFLVVPKLLK